MTTQLTIGQTGEITLPSAIRDRYGLTPQTPLRLIETRNGILLVPLTDEPMNAELAEGLAQWQALAGESREVFPYENTDE